VAALKEALKESRPGWIEIEAEVALSSRPLDVDVWDKGTGPLSQKRFG